MKKDIFLIPGKRPLVYGQKFFKNFLRIKNFGKKGFELAMQQLIIVIIVTVVFLILLGFVLWQKEYLSDILPGLSNILR